MSDEFDFFGVSWEAAERLQAKVRQVLLAGWREIRPLLMQASVVSADDEMFLLTDPDHMGDAASRIDTWMHQSLAHQLVRAFDGLQVLGEEGATLNLLLDPRRFRLLAYLDALDGSRQAFTLPGGWSINIVLQQYLGIGTGDKMPRCRVALLAVIDAEGVSAIWSPGIRGVDLRLGDAAEGTVHSDQLLITEGETFGVTGDTTVLAGGYKPDWWEPFRALREALPDYAVFNTGGGPVTRKALQNDDIVVVQLVDSTLWDGIPAGLIAAAGGFVCPVGGVEPLAMDTVLAMFDVFGYVRSEDDPGRLVEAYVIPAFVAGMDLGRVQRVAGALKR